MSEPTHRAAENQALLVCVQCKGPLLESVRALRCAQCAITCPVENEIADFARGSYFDQFTPGQQLRPEHLEGLEREQQGSRTRARYYLGRLRSRFGEQRVRVLDCGCGNGMLVDELNAAGYETWGNDLSQLRRWQWNSRHSRRQLVVASGSALPFPDNFFDAVIASGVLEHIGVSESWTPPYRALPKETRDRDRQAFIRELFRVVAAGGSIYLDFPNGDFPVDFWHGDRPGSARFHSLSEGFLPTLAEVRQLVQTVRPRAKVDVQPLRGRLAFSQVRSHWYGRLFGPAATLLVRIVSSSGVRKTPLARISPFLVVELSESEDSPS